MRRSVLLLLALCVTLSISAEERGYQFTITHGEHGIRLADGAGTHWRWVEIGCPPSKPDCEWKVNDNGANQPDSDFGISEKSEATVQVRCLRSSCSVAYGSESGKIASGETIQIPFNARVAITFVEERR